MPLLRQWCPRGQALLAGAEPRPQRHPMRDSCQHGRLHRCADFTQQSDLASAQHKACALFTFGGTQQSLGWSLSRNDSQLPGDCCLAKEICIQKAIPAMQVMATLSTHPE